MVSYYSSVSDSVEEKLLSFFIKLSMYPAQELEELKTSLLPYTSKVSQQVDL